MFHYLLLYIEPLPLPHGVHVLAGLVFRICLFPKVQILLLGGGDPERISGDDLGEKRNGVKKPRYWNREGENRRRWKPQAAPCQNELPLIKEAQSSLPLLFK